MANNAYGIHESDKELTCPPCDWSTVHPFYHHQPKSKRLLTFEKLDNPFPKEITDTDELKAFFRAYKGILVPFAVGQHGTQHSLLRLFNAMPELSTTQGACIMKRKAFVLGGKFDVVRSRDFDFCFEEEQEIIPADKLAYSQFLNDIFYKAGSLKKEILNAFEEFDTNGNAFIEVQISETLGQQTAFVTHHKTERCLYLATSEGQQKYVAISPEWSEKYLDKHSPLEIPLFPTFEEVEGNMRSIIHIKNGNFEWYGRPQSRSSLMYQYREFQDCNYLVKQSANNFVGQIFIEVEQSNPDYASIQHDAGQHASFGERLEYNFTNRSGDPSTIVATERGFGAKPALVKQFTPNTNENWYKVTGEIAENKILVSHGLTRKLVFDDKTGGLTQGGFMDNFTTQEVTHIEQDRNIILSAFNRIFEQLAVFMNENMKDFSLVIKSPIAKIREHENTDQSL